VIVGAEEVPARFLDRIALAFDLIDPHYALHILIYTPGDTPGEHRQMIEEENPLIETAEREGRLLDVLPAA
jgi:hypothetical protein